MISLHIPPIDELIKIAREDLLPTSETRKALLSLNYKHTYKLCSGLTVASTSRGIETKSLAASLASLEASFSACLTLLASLLK